MEIDTLSEKAEHLCAAASIDELDMLVEHIYNPHIFDTAYANNLLHFTYAVDSKKIRWEKIRHLRIIGDADAERVWRFGRAGLPRGFYQNASGNWLMVILPKKTRVSDYFARCGQYLDSMWVLNTRQIYFLRFDTTPNLRCLCLEDNRQLDSLDQLSRLTRLEKLSIRNCPRILELSGLEYLVR